MKPAPPESGKRSALRELEAAARLGAAVLLALDDATVPGEEPALLENGPELRFEVRKGLRNAMTHRAGLPAEAAAGDGRNHVVLVLAGCGDDRLLQDHLQHWPGEEDVEV